MNINISHVRTHLLCPMKAYYEHTLRRVPLRHPRALAVGTAWHALMAHYLSRTPSIGTGSAQGDALVEGARVLSEQPLTGEDVEKAAQEFANLAAGFIMWEQPEDWEVIAVEKVLRGPLGRHTLEGTLDTIVKWNGQYWHLQHKTIAANKTLSLYQEFMVRDWHECAYEYLATLDGERLPYGGTMLLTARKVSKKAALEDPQKIMAWNAIPRPRFVVDKAIADLTRLADEIEEGVGNPLQIIHNNSSCAGMFGNSLCGYLGVCNGEAELEDDTKFKTVEPRYSETIETE